MVKKLSEQKVDKNKLREALRYLMSLERAKGKKLPETHYMKILWFFEGFSYLITGTASIGIKFTKHDYGPYSKVVKETLKELRSSEKYKSQSSLKDWEIKLLSMLFVKLSSKPAKFVSEITHGKYYRAKKHGEKLHPLAILEYFIEKPSEEDKKWALEAYERFKKKQSEGKLF